MCISLTVLSVSGTASATLIESIAALEEGAMYRVLFVTSTSTRATSSDIEFYNNFVSTAAVSGSVTGGLGLTWKALASTTGMNAQVNTGILSNDSSLVTLFNTFGEIVATSGLDLWNGNISAAIRSDEYGSDAGFGLVWTGTDWNANVNLNRTMGSQYVYVGYQEATDSRWMIQGARDSARSSLAIYAVSSAAMKPVADVPEPGTAILLSLGLAGLSFARYRKQY
jgi:hypothetical protein